MLKRPVLEFVNEACLHSLPPKQSLFTFYTNTIPQQRYLLMQHSRTSRWIILIHVASSRGRSGWQEVNRDISTITGANSVRSRRVNGLYIQDMGNPFNVSVFLQKKVTASQKKKNIVLQDNFVHFCIRFYSYRFWSPCMLSVIPRITNNVTKSDYPNT